MLLYLYIYKSNNAIYESNKWRVYYCKNISSNINSEEDVFILNITMVRFEEAFNFSSLEDIKFAVDNINIIDNLIVIIILILLIKKIKCIIILLKNIKMN